MKNGPVKYIHDGSNVIPFPRIPLRAIVVIPSGAVHLDQCETRFGGWPPNEIPAAVGMRGNLRGVMRRLRDNCTSHGLPISVHGECVRRAAL